MRGTTGKAAAVTVFDEGERRAWSGQAAAYAGSFAGLCAYPVPRLLDAAGVGAGARVLDVGTGPGTAAAAACERGAKVAAVDAEPGMVDLAARAVPAAAVGVAVLPRLPFADAGFDAVVGNFVLDHLGRPREAVAELRRVLRPGGMIALTAWAVPGAPGQELLGRALRAAGAVRPPHLPPLAPEDDFPRDERGLADLLRSAGLREASCVTLRWEHRATAAQWWGGRAAGVGFSGQVVVSQPAGTRAEIKRHFDLLCQEFTGADGRLVLPHAALLAWAVR